MIDEEENHLVRRHMPLEHTGRFVSFRKYTRGRCQFGLAFVVSISTGEEEKPKFKRSWPPIPNIPRRNAPPGTSLRLVYVNPGNPLDFYLGGFGPQVSVELLPTKIFGPHLKAHGERPRGLFFFQFNTSCIIRIL